MVALEPGLGFASGVVIDQHFGERNRQGRLIEAVVKLSRRRIVGIGVDENTAVAVRRDGTAEIVGQGTAVCVSPSKEGHRIWRRARPGEPLQVSDVRISTLTSGTLMALPGISPRVSPVSSAPLSP
jgi:cyanophycinase